MGFNSGFKGLNDDTEIIWLLNMSTSLQVKFNNSNINNNIYSIMTEKLQKFDIQTTVHGDIFL